MADDDLKDTKLKLEKDDAVEVLIELRDGLDMPSMVEEYVALGMAIDALHRVEALIRQVAEK